ncbi:Cytochrome C' [Fodinibius salinus]|uniref:Cytochrome C n=1 Tax=Fodinibius salinus TaxID=860790 RepID=A0A5D3YN91_9BACT|nr:cytochrome c [Fodinibius salinus]TYP94808.1 Cytochrome C' [Fodinibius salinus]
MKKSILIFTVLAGFSISVMGWSWYPQQKASQPETMSLVPMMQQLLKDIQQVDRGVFTENFEMIKEGAGNISDHPTMTAEDKKLVKQTLGKEMKQFVEFDMVVHHHADSMRMAAVRKNMQNVLKHYRITQQGCVDCHSNYREKISTARLEK